uniref:Uncharacterized protein n=1 Tax=uncultured marine microorganism HF4000_APKG2J17 TaxID=455546 RepID=B3T6J9_9ZZZZ|nr:hypothetical protein ALOHA_HF4000APKG2J17ctg1g15 [uncultured marine microorganism HF4000_APKG2J17]
MAEFDGEYLLSLARDKSGKRRKLLAETISDLFSGKGHVLTERERTLMFDILHKMVHNAEMAVRRIIAEQLSKISEAPKDLILLLANDEVECWPMTRSRSLIPFCMTAPFCKTKT